MSRDNFKSKYPLGFLGKLYTETFISRLGSVPVFEISEPRAQDIDKFEKAE